MSQLFIDSFSGYSTADLPTRYPGQGGTGQITTALLPPNAQAGAQVWDNTNGGSGPLSTNYGPQARMILGIRHYATPDNVDNAGFICQFNRPVGLGPFNIRLTAGLYHDNSGTYIVDENAAILATGPVVPFNEWHHYEVDITFSTTGTGSAHVYLDGNPTPIISATGLTFTAAAANQFMIAAGAYNGGPVQNNVSTGYYADLYVFNGLGAAPFNAALAPQGLGAAKMAFAVPNGPGAASAWTPNGAATIWQCINQIPQDGDTTYASDVTPGDQYMCTFGALPAMQTLISVQLSCYARTDDAGPRAYQSGFYSGGTYGYSGVNEYLAGTYNYIEDEFMLNPVTGAAWLPGDLVGLQFGAKLTV